MKSQTNIDMEAKRPKRTVTNFAYKLSSGAWLDLIDMSSIRHAQEVENSKRNRRKKVTTN